MNTPANLFPGLNDIADILEEYPIEVARYMTLLHEIDAKCVYTVPKLGKDITKLFEQKENGAKHFKQINKQFKDLIPSLEEKIHVSSIAYESLEKLVTRIELAYEVALKNQEIPSKIRLGDDAHPAMHLHHELMKKIESKQQTKSQQALRSESRREAMAAKKQQHTTESLSAATSSSSSGAHVNNTYTATATYPSETSGFSTIGLLEPTTKHQNVDVAVVTPANTTRKRKRQCKEDYSLRPKTNEYGEALYCYCNQVAYGEMVGCDGESCQLEWFHLPCINLEILPKGKWYCEDCKK